MTVSNHTFSGRIGAGEGGGGEGGGGNLKLKIRALKNLLCSGRWHVKCHGWEGGIKIE